MREDSESLVDFVGKLTWDEVVVVPLGPGPCACDVPGCRCDEGELEFAPGVGLCGCCAADCPDVHDSDDEVVADDTAGVATPVRRRRRV